MSIMMAGWPQVNVSKMEYAFKQNDKKVKRGAACAKS